MSITEDWLVELVQQNIHLGEELVDYFNGTLESPLKEEVECHLDVCQVCRDDVAFWSRLLLLPFEDEEVDDDEWDLEDLLSHTADEP